jgi:hypothetical protein
VLKKCTKTRFGFKNFGFLVVPKKCTKAIRIKIVIFNCAQKCTKRDSDKKLFYVKKFDFFTIIIFFFKYAKKMHKCVKKSFYLALSRFFLHKWLKYTYQYKVKQIMDLPLSIHLNNNNEERYQSIT